MDIKITKASLSGRVRAIASKSQAHRLLICAAMSDGETFIECPESSDDIEATAGCLKSLGADILRGKDGYFVTPMIRPVSQERKKLDCGESGTTYRFMLPIACAVGAQAAFILSGRLPARPTAPLLKELALHGCEITGLGGSPVYSSGQMENGTFTLPGNISSQFVSGLLLALPLLKGDSIIVVEGTEESKPYVDMTIQALQRFGIKIGTAQGRYHIAGGQTYNSPGTAVVEGDWSNAAFWLCAGALSESGVTCFGLNLNSAQGDMAVVKHLERFGASVAYDGNSVSVSRRGALRGIEIDAGDTPDLVPVLSAVASAAEGETTIYNAGRLRIKESDRLKAVTQTLGKLGADIRESRDGLIIKGKQYLNGGTVSSHGDHRIAMTAAIAAALCKNPVTITQAESVNKSYPGFLKDFCALGGISEVL